MDQNTQNDVYFKPNSELSPKKKELSNRADDQPLAKLLW
jgi:hypothetical protein